MCSAEKNQFPAKYSFLFTAITTLYCEQRVSNFNKVDIICSYFNIISGKTYFTLRPPFNK
jgi:hypothetical protein